MAEPRKTSPFTWAVLAMILVLGVAYRGHQMVQSHRVGEAVDSFEAFMGTQPRYDNIQILISGAGATVILHGSVSDQASLQALKKHGSQFTEITIGYDIDLKGQGDDSGATAAEP